MGQDSKIEWTHHTFNPWWGCVKVSPGCANCYAEGFAKRTGNDVWGKDSERRFFPWGGSHWKEPLKWNAAAEKEGIRKRVFCASMADVFEGRPELISQRAELFRLIHATPWLDWLLLTKRPENIEAFLYYVQACFAAAGQKEQFEWMKAWLEVRVAPKNVWLGTSAEDQSRWDERVDVLMDVPAQVHFVSAEPLLGPIDMGDVRPDWLIVGGESGPKARPMEPKWVVDLQAQCWGDERTAFFFKQWGGVNKAKTGRELHGRTWDAVPFTNPLPEAPEVIS